MWRWPGQLPPLPLPPPSARGRPRGRGDKAGGAPRSPPPTSPLARLLAHSSLASLAPALGRYSSPIVPRKQNGGVGGEDPVRAHPSPPSRPLVPWQRLARGVRAHRAPSRSLSPTGLCLLRRSACARARVRCTHPPPAWSIPASAAGATPPSPAPLCPTLAPASRRVPGSGGGKRGRLCPYMERGVGPPFLP